jgi:hypothetical protein
LEFKEKLLRRRFGSLYTFSLALLLVLSIPGYFIHDAVEALIISLWEARGCGKTHCQLEAECQGMG